MLQILVSFFAIIFGAHSGTALPAKATTTPLPSIVAPAATIAPKIPPPATHHVYATPKPIFKVAPDVVIPESPLATYTGPTQRALGDDNCPIADVETIQLTTGPVPVCYIPSDGKEVFVCITYGDHTWSVVRGNDADPMGCPAPSMAGKIDPDRQHF